MTTLTKLLIGGGVGVIAWQLLKPKNDKPDPAELPHMQKAVIEAIQKPARGQITKRPIKMPVITKRPTGMYATRPAGAPPVRVGGTSIFSKPQVAPYKQVTSPVRYTSGSLFQTKRR